MKYNPVFFSNTFSSLVQIGIPDTYLPQDKYNLCFVEFTFLEKDLFSNTTGRENRYE